MAEIKKIVKRRNSAKNIKKITKTMALIAAAKFKVAVRRVETIQPYTKKLNELLADLMASDEKLQHPLAQAHSQKRQVALVVIASQRGLCGSYNSKILEHAANELQSLREENLKVTIHLVGKRAVQFFAKRFPDAERNNYLDFSDNPDYSELQGLMEQFMQQYVNHEIDELRVVSMDFASSSRQGVRSVSVLPFPVEKYQTGGSSTEYEKHPGAKEIFDYVVPKSISANFFTIFLEAAASEHVQRMIAMNTATDNAENMIKELTKMYNRARQAKITTELSEIMGAARALEKG